MTSLLVPRPAYGEGSSRTPVAEARLPEGGPVDRGLPLDPGISGYSTHDKPVDDVREQDKDDESIHRVDGPDDIAKSRDRIDVVDLSKLDVSYNTGPGGRDPDDYSKTKYPYRDDKPNTHNAAEFVAHLHILEYKQPVLLKHAECLELRVAATAEQILSGLNPAFASRARKVSVLLRRTDARNLRWIFSVTGNHTYVVKVKATRPRKNTTKFSKMDLEIACSCPAWQWQGPEFHSTSEEYQLGKLIGTAAPPNIRDPGRRNRVCKHVAAVLEATKGWDIPIK